MVTWLLKLAAYLYQKWRYTGILWTVLFLEKSNLAVEIGGLLVSKLEVLRNFMDRLGSATPEPPPLSLCAFCAVCGVSNTCFPELSIVGLFCYYRGKRDLL